MASLPDIFADKFFMPHGHCYLWEPTIVWLQVFTNMVIGLAYVAISAMLATLVYKIRDLPFKKVYAAFGTFIISCGITHFFDVAVIWRPIYWSDTLCRAITAVASMGTAIMLPALLPRAHALMEGARAAHRRGIALETAVADLEAMYQKTRQVERLKSNFFAGVSHDLRTPLALILGPVEQLAGQAHVGERERALLATIEGNARLLLGYVGDLLDTAKLDAGALQAIYERADIMQVVRQTTAHFAALAQERAIDFQTVAEGSLEVDIDVDKTRRVLLNLLSNAFKVTPVGGRVVCACVAAGDGAVQLRVEDSGPGVPAERRQEIFQRFVQLADAPVSGSGLGLSIVHDFVAIQGGQVAVDGSPLGGASFVVHLPSRAPAEALVASPERPDDVAHQVASALAEARSGAARRAGGGVGGAPADDVDAGPLAGPDGARGAAERAPVGDREAAADPAAVPAPLPAGGDTLAPADGSQEPASPEGLRPEILVVEDNPAMRHFLAEVLAEDYQVRTAEDGQAALAAVGICAPDLVISDRMMPLMTGDEMLRRLRDEPATAALPVLLLTAQDDPGGASRLLTAGAQDFLAKPFRLAELRARVGNLVAAKRTRDILEGQVAVQGASLDQLARGLQIHRVRLEAALAEARAAQAESARLSASRADFMHLIAHELGTPLTALRLQVGRLARHLDELPERRRPLIAQLDVSTRRVSDLVASLMQFNRICTPQGTLAIQRSRFAVADLWAELGRDFAVQAESADVALTWQVAPRALELFCDRELIRVAVGHLVANALKFTPAGGAVGVLADREGEALRLTVRDNGRGIEAAQQAAIFEPFVHLEAIRHKHTPGVGLGLPLVRAIVQALGGTLTLVSGSGEGAAFTISLADPEIPSAQSSERLL